MSTHSLSDKNPEGGTTTMGSKTDPTTAATAPVPKPTTHAEGVISFDRWFSSQGRPVHHKFGMKAFITKTHIQGKRTVSAWNDLFKNY